jgi:DNA repair exonuclease SbcCD nuclease subunit
MIKFAHFADCHLGGWRQEELQSLNFQAFQKAVDLVIQERPDFLLLAGDLFDSAYPPIEILKDAFGEFKKLKEANIPVFMIAGSHDFSASGKTFLDVLEKAGFCSGIDKFEVQADGRIKLLPTQFKELTLLGYSGKKSGMEIEDLKKTYLESVYPLSVFAFHSTIKDVVGTIPMDSIEKEKLPLANYYAMGHIHQRFEAKMDNSIFVYPGPIFPNNFQELADLKCGSFEMIEMDSSRIKTRNVLLPIKDVVSLELTLENGLSATEEIISAIDKLNLRDKIFLLRLTGTLTQGKSGDIRFDEIEKFVTKKEAHSFLRNISSLKTKETELEIQIDHKEDVEKKIIEEYSAKNPADFNKIIESLMHSLSIEKNEDEKEVIYEKRLIDDLKKVLGVGDMLL